MPEVDYRDIESEMVIEEGQYVCHWIDEKSQVIYIYLHEKPPYFCQYIVNPRRFTPKPILHSLTGQGWFRLMFDYASDAHELMVFEKSPLATVSMSMEVFRELRGQGLDSLINEVRMNFKNQIAD